MCAATSKVTTKMGRRKKGDRVDGWLIVDKPAGLSSNAVVNKVRWALNAQKAGHSGTLDPEATGILAIALGEATKTIPFVTDALKAYRFVVRLGAATNTDDAEGQIIAQSDARPSTEAISQALGAFTGDILQVPPQFSAVKIDGQRAYHHARAGQEVDIAPRPLFVEALCVIERPDPDHVVLEMTCGKGGYVRSIARDLGAELGCFAHVKTLRRIWSGPFELDDSIAFETVETLAKDPALLDHLLPLEAGLHDVPELRCRPAEAAALRNGNPAQVITCDAEFGELAWASCDGEAIAIGTYKAGKLFPTRVFNSK